MRYRRVRVDRVITASRGFHASKKRTPPTVFEYVFYPTYIAMAVTLPFRFACQQPRYFAKPALKVNIGTFVYIE